MTTNEAKCLYDERLAQYGVGGALALLLLLALDPINNDVIDAAREGEEPK